MSIIKKIKELGRLDSYFNKTNRNSYDTLSSLLIHRLFPKGTILPFTPFSLNPNTILHVINEIQLNKRRSIIEFGSGISTIVLAKFIKENKIDAQVVAVEENESWANYIKAELKKYDCEKFASVLHVPLAPCKTKGHTGSWHDVPLLKESIKGKTFDLMIVDGPGAYEEKEIRYPAAIEMIDYFERDFVIFLDDIRRKGEQHIYKKWKQFLATQGHKVQGDIIDSKVYAVIQCGEGFSTYPMSY
ncbi:hypothetical protein ACFQ1M_17985 [Sungkyunkwania multivorans]|uniref:Class I SAM-dependent methyltransferase n=1 Tax=Sungkyunkwania multivorans TaxID=1173618 RepID=A0ABW3D239_9FLAO